MMPTFPPPPLKFRTVSFPQYGFKASLSDPACPARPAVKPAPGMPAGPGWSAMVLRARAGYATLGAPVHSPKGQSGVVFTNGRAADPRGPWLRSELCCLRSSSLTPTPSASLAGTARLHRVTAYTRGLRCAGAPRRPTRPSLLSLACCPPVPPTLPRWVRWPFPLSGRSGTRLPRITSESPPTSPSLPAIPDGGPFRGCIVRVMLRPVRLPGPPGWLQRGAGTPYTPPAEVPCHSRFWHWPSPGSAGSQARWANGKSPIVGTFTRQVTTGSEAAP